MDTPINQSYYGILEFRLLPSWDCWNHQVSTNLISPKLLTINLIRKYVSQLMYYGAQGEIRTLNPKGRQGLNLLCIPIPPPELINYFNNFHNRTRTYIELCYSAATLPFAHRLLIFTYRDSNPEYSLLI